MKVRNVSNCVIYHIGRSPPATRLLWAPLVNIPTGKTDTLPLCLLLHGEGGEGEVVGRDVQYIHL